VEPVPESAQAVFGTELPRAQRYADLLVSEGVLRGVLGPREPERIWSRHLLNCAVVTDLVQPGARVVDVGSGAGLPGLAMAIRRPDLRIDLVEPLQRRIDFLTEGVERLGLGSRVRVLRGRADEPQVRDVAGDADWVTARAVAPVDRLVRWCLPLLATDGRLALLKGRSVATELEEHRAALQRAGSTAPEIVRCGTGMIDPAVIVVTCGRAPRTRTRKGTR
jgi:16S rRNA (guanine527-N7)-methyltransferase